MNETLYNLTILLTTHCTLKCKFRATYASTLPHPSHFSSTKMLQAADRFFACMGSHESVNLLTLSGGEPLLHPQLLEILKGLTKHLPQVQKFEIITNGTIVPQDAILQQLSHMDKVDVMIDHYGDILSPKVHALAAAFDRYGIAYRIRDYHSENPHLGGWLDISDFTDKHRTPEENAALFQKCQYSTTFSHHFFIIDGLAFMCYVNHKLLPQLQENDNEHVDMLDESLSQEALRAQLLELRNKQYQTLCARCNGFCVDGPRYAPAEQLP